MQVYKVYYQTPETFRETSMIDVTNITLENLNKSHVYLKEMGANDLEDLYYRMQGENWSPNGEARELIASKNLAHTSMSVGNVVRDCMTGKTYVVDVMGFKELTE